MEKVMKKLFVSLLIGTIAGVLDVIPMIMQGLDWYANASAFLHWVVMGVLISYVVMPLRNWVTGLIIAEISVIPIIILVLKDDPTSVIPILIMSAFLGSLVGLFTDKYSNPKYA